jgi:hypothetical protein
MATEDNTNAAPKRPDPPSSRVPRPPVKRSPQLMVMDQPPGTPTSKPEVPTQPAVDFVRPGVHFSELGAWVSERRAYYQYMAGRHRTGERRWRLTAGILAWLTAVLAAVSGITAVTSNEQIATGLALLTALAAATNAAVNPADIARKRRTAALVYGRHGLRLSDIWFFELGTSRGEVPIDEVRRIRAELTKMDADVLALNQEGSA